mgnify:FL=1|tara:strand:- start:566 stop:709 length:144 start_codon:yes stop_codon:yes gene_type:complete
MKKDETLRLRVPKEGKILIQEEAKKNSQSISAFVRNKLFNEYVKVKQ